MRFLKNPSGEFRHLGPVSEVNLNTLCSSARLSFCLCRDKVPVHSVGSLPLSVFPYVSNHLFYLLFSIPSFLGRGPIQTAPSRPKKMISAGANAGQRTAGGVCPNLKVAAAELLRGPIQSGMSPGSGSGRRVSSAARHTRP